MNLGVYTDVLGNTGDLLSAVKSINEGVENGELEDASIFYDSASNDFPSVAINCGCFNSTDLWNFTGSLVTTGKDLTKNALAMINKFDIIYYHGWKEDQKLNTISLIEIATNPKVKVVCRDEDGCNNLKRLTGLQSKIVNEFNIKELLEVAK